MGPAHLLMLGRPIGYLLSLGHVLTSGTQWGEQAHLMKQRGLRWVKFVCCRQQLVSPVVILNSTYISRIVSGTVLSFI